jgi:hypothetical protein
MAEGVRRGVPPSIAFVEVDAQGPRPHWARISVPENPENKERTGVSSLIQRPKACAAT